MSGGQIAALIAAAAFVLLVGLLAVPILKLGRTLDEATLALRGAREGAAPILSHAATTVEQINGQLERVDGITANAESVATNVAALTSAITGVLGGPVIKVAAFSYGVRRAVRARRAGDQDPPARRRPGRTGGSRAARRRGRHR